MYKMEQKLLDYFIDHTNARFLEVKTEIHELREFMHNEHLSMKKEIDSLKGFKWKVTGMVIATVAILEIALKIFVRS